MSRAALLLVLTVVVSCAVNPVTRRPEVTVVSRATELEIGAEQARAVARGMGLVDDAALVAYVRSVGNRIAASSPRQDVPYGFHVVDTPEPNAFAVPGHVYVSRGLLVVMNDEDELACVLAHEVGHIAARHAAQRLTRELPAGILTGVVSGVTSLASPLLGSLFQAGGSLATEALLAPYSREQEREADRVGQEIAARAGFDPAALGRSLATLERVAALGDEPRRRPSFFDSHPTTPERARATAAYAGDLPRTVVAGTAATRDAFLAHLDGVVVGQSASQGVFEKTTFLHPELGFHVRFPPDWKTENGATHVAGAAPDGSLMVAVTIAAEGVVGDAAGDPMVGVRAFEKDMKQPLMARVDRLTIGELPAAHMAGSAVAAGRRVAVELFWVALDGRVFQVTGVGDTRAEADRRALMAAIAKTFGRLSADERSRIRERRLRLATARPRESLTAFALRTGTAWKPEVVAAANGLPPGAPLPTDRRLKVALDEPYPPAR